ncbi:MAG: hypothetical protein U1E65_21675 [Myxococcota bacterium]
MRSAAIGLLFLGACARASVGAAPDAQPSERADAGPAAADAGTAALDAGVVASDAGGATLDTGVDSDAGLVASDAEAADLDAEMVASDTGAVPSDAGPLDSDAGSAADSGYPRLPCSRTVGTGSGRLELSAASGAPGEVLCVMPGSYREGSIRDLQGLTLQNGAGLVTITGPIEIAGLIDVTWSGSGDPANEYGFLLSGAQASFVIRGPNRGLHLHHFEAIEAGIFLDAGHTDLVWNGSPTELVLYNSVLDRLHLVRSQQLFQGNYGPLTDYKNFASDIEMANVIVEDSRGTGQNVVAGGGIFNLNVHDWFITGQNNVLVGSADDRDTGVISIFGSGRFVRLHRSGGWGWLVRTFGLQLGPSPGEFHCEQNVDLNTEYYGTCEIRNEDSPSYLVPGLLSTVEIFIEGNVSAHKRDVKGGYTTAIGLIPNLRAGTTAHIHDNLGCDNTNDYGDVDSLHFWTVNGTIDQSGNRALADCSGQFDPITHDPL